MREITLERKILNAGWNIFLVISILILSTVFSMAITGIFGRWNDKPLVNAITILVFIVAVLVFYEKRLNIQAQSIVQAEKQHSFLFIVFFILGGILSLAGKSFFYLVASPEVLKEYGLYSAELLFKNGVIWGLFEALLFGIALEEFIFRGVLLYELRKIMPAWMAISFQALLFALIHDHWFQMCYTFLLGLMLGWIVTRYRNLYLAGFLHLGFNLIGIL